MAITVIEYIAHNVPEELDNVIVHYGIEEAQDIPDLISKTEYLLQWNPSLIKDELLNIHPDRDDIIDFYKRTQATPETLTVQPTTPTYKRIPQHKDSTDSTILKVAITGAVVIALYQLLK